MLCFLTQKKTKDPNMPNTPNGSDYPTVGAVPCACPKRGVKTDSGGPTFRETPCKRSPNPDASGFHSKNNKIKCCIYSSNIVTSECSLGVAELAYLKA